jgi:type IV secretion system protein VirB10
VVDLAPPSAEAGAAAPGQDALGGAGSKASGSPGAGKTSETGLNADEQFAARVEGSEPNRARATVLKNRSAVVAQGSTIPAVLETALDSDLPGFARAVVSRDVRSFDGTSVLIPRGARVIGEYKSLASQGQSRAFVVWTRLLRPDGVSIQIGSPVTDPLGRAGLAGTVDHHYLQQFGGAVLLTLLNAGANALSGVPSTEVVVGSSTPAAGLASTASAFAPAPLPPTIKVPQGTPIRIFVARDLDFSSVEGRSP